MDGSVDNKYDQSLMLAPIAFGDRFGVGRVTWSNDGKSVMSATCLTGSDISFRYTNNLAADALVAFEAGDRSKSGCNIYNRIKV